MKKIHIFEKTSKGLVYLATTTRFKTCKAAVASYRADGHDGNFVARFDR